MTRRHGTHAAPARSRAAWRSGRPPSLLALASVRASLPTCAAARRCWPARTSRGALRRAGWPPAARALLAGCAVWLWLVTTAVVLEAARDGPGSAAWLPGGTTTLGAGRLRRGPRRRRRARDRGRWSRRCRRRGARPGPRTAPARRAAAARPGARSTRNARRRARAPRARRRARSASPRATRSGRSPPATCPADASAAAVDRHWRAIWAGRTAAAIGPDPISSSPAPTCGSHLDEDVLMSPFHDNVTPLPVTGWDAAPVGTGQRAGHPRPRPRRRSWRHPWRPGAAAALDGADVVPVVAPAVRRELHRWAMTFAQACVEVVLGDRPVSQLVRWTSPAVHREMAYRAGVVARAGVHRAGQGRGRRPVVRPQVENVRTCFVDDEAVEMCVRVQVRRAEPGPGRAARGHRRAVAVHRAGVRVSAGRERPGRRWSAAAPCGLRERGRSAAGRALVTSPSTQFSSLR